MGSTAGTHDGLGIRRVPERERYEVYDDAEVLAVLQYEDVPADEDGGGRIRDLRSTVVAPEAGGRGIGSLLVRHALDDARDAGVKVKTTCWFARGWIERHPEYADLLAAEEER